MHYRAYVDEKLKLINKKLNFQRWFYAFIGIINVLAIIFLTLRQAQNIEKQNHEFAFFLLLIEHSGLLKN